MGGFITPRYDKVILVDGVLNTLRMAFSAIIGAVVIALNAIFRVFRSPSTRITSSSGG